MNPKRSPGPVIIAPSHSLIYKAQVCLPLAHSQFSPSRCLYSHSLSAQSVIHCRWLALADEDRSSYFLTHRVRSLFIDVYEGAADKGGSGPKKIEDKSNEDVAVDSYHRYKENLMEEVLAVSSMDVLLVYLSLKLTCKWILTEGIRPGQRRITTPRKETDTCKIFSGVSEGLTTGTPIHVFVPNTDQRVNDYNEMSLAYRPFHADATYDMKYGGGGSSSARETIGRVASGAIATKILKDFSGTEEKNTVERMRSFPQQKFLNLASHFYNNVRHCHKAFAIKCNIIKTFLFTW
ncbi:hypothetical protein V8G54_037231 [Vigna mungo]|uniref:chorismate synthase n=1 Tax=Vigna mungo TaxID=3915 RepID=A0AAQ3MIF3_VIGMU